VEKEGEGWIKGRGRGENRFEELAGSTILIIGLGAAIFIAATSLAQPK